MLTTSNNYSNNFLVKKRLLLDSCILIDLAKDQRTSNILDRANNTYSFVYCTVSLLEVGFGLVENVNHQEDRIARKIYLDNDVIPIDSKEFTRREMQQIEDPHKAVFSYNPGHHEYYASRTHLMKAMEIRRIAGKRARELRNDALIFYSAWNTRSTLLTNNVNDFVVFNDVQKSINPKHLLPIFNIDDLERSFEQDVVFPANL
jgi:predicted nucleic acid-binding protein